MFKKRRAKKELDALRAEIDINLMNNYKSVAHEARIRFGQRIEEMYKESRIDEATYKEYKRVYGEYCEKMANYRH